MAATMEASEKRQTQVVLTTDLMKRLDSEARRRTTSRSLLIREACEMMLASGGSVPPIGYTMRCAACSDPDDRGNNYNPTHYRAGGDKKK